MTDQTATHTNATKPIEAAKVAAKPVEAKPATSPAPVAAAPEKTRAPRGSLPAPTKRETFLRVSRLLSAYSAEDRKTILSALVAADELE